MAETITISKDEYISLLRCKAALAEHLAAETKKPPSFVPIGIAQKWMSVEETAEILRLNHAGLRAGEIVKKVGRPYSTVQRCIRNQRNQG